MSTGVVLSHQNIKPRKAHPYPEKGPTDLANEAGGLRLTLSLDDLLLALLLGLFDNEHGALSVLLRDLLCLDGRLEGSP
jgi:hypothetical protein